MTLDRRLALALFIAVGACGGEDVTAPPAVTSIQVTPGQDTLVTLGRTRQFTAVARDASGNPVSGVTLVWSSSNPAVATVDGATGVVTAVGNGLSIIRADAGGVIGQATLAVVQVVATVVVTPASRTFTVVSDTQRFAAVAKDSGAATVPGVRFLWVSSNPAVATVDTLGLATSRGSGQTTISALGRGVPGYAGLSVNQAARLLVFSTPPSSIVAGEAINPAVQVEVRDSAGHIVSDSRITVTLSFGVQPGGAVLHGSTIVNAVSGVATFSGITIEKAANQYTLVATSAGIPPDSSLVFAVAPAAVARIAMTAPDSVRNGALLSPPPSVSLYDRFNNLASNAIDTVVLHVATSDWGGHLVGALAGVPTGGVATFPGVRFSNPGQFTLGATVGPIVTVVAPVSTLQRVTFTQITAGSDNSCGLTAITVFCWGANDVGQLGDGTFQSDSVPTLVDPSVTFASLASGGQATCGLTSAGAAYCWGDVSFTIDSAPVPVPGGRVFTSLVVGAEHQCGLIAGGAAYCWGTNFYGELGDSTRTFRAAPVAVHGGHSFDALTAGGGFTCGRASGTAYCWGFNLNGQLGNGTTDTALVPMAVAVAGGLPYTELEAGSGHTCSVVSGGDAYCWGNDFAGQTGDTLFRQRDTLPSLVQGGLQFLAVVAGGTHSCGITTVHYAYCWGDANAGALGFPSFGTAIPGQVTGLLNFTTLALGTFRSCGLTATGQAYCWGNNATGAIGDGSSANRSAPTPVVQ